MKAEVLRAKLKKYLNPEEDAIILEVIQGTPKSAEGGIWIDVDINDLERLTEKPNFDKKKTGWSKYFDKWADEGLITQKEKETGRS